MMESVKMTHQHQYRQKFMPYTYAPVSHILYHLGPTAFKGDSCGTMTVTDANKHCWLALTAPDVQEKLKIKIPGGQMGK